MVLGCVGGRALLGRQRCQLVLNRSWRPVSTRRALLRSGAFSRGRVAGADGSVGWGAKKISTQLNVKVV